MHLKFVWTLAPSVGIPQCWNHFASHLSLPRFTPERHAKRQTDRHAPGNNNKKKPSADGTQTRVSSRLQRAHISFPVCRVDCAAGVEDGSQAPRGAAAHSVARRARRIHPLHLARESGLDAHALRRLHGRVSVCRACLVPWRGAALPRHRVEQNRALPPTRRLTVALGAAQRIDGASPLPQGRSRALRTKQSSRKDPLSKAPMTGRRRKR